MPPRPVDFDHDSLTLVSRGREAWRSLRNDETWEKWVAIGRALEAGRTAIMRHLHTNQPKGRAWSETFGPWLKDNEFDEIDKGVRSRLQNCLDHLPEIEAWRQNLGLTQRLQLNHPNAVWRRWQAAQTAPTGGPGSRPPAPNKKDMAIVELQEALDKATRELERMKHEHGNTTEGRDWTWHDRPEQIAEAMMASHPDKAKRLGAALQNLSKTTTRKPRGKAGSP